MNLLWGGMMIVGIVYATITGNLEAVTTQALDSAKEAITLCIAMAGVMSFWVGLMRIAECAGIISGATAKLKPLLHFLFPGLPKDSDALEPIATNMVANFFGLGWAATPAGLDAMKKLQQLEKDKAGKRDLFHDGKDNSKSITREKTAWSQRASMEMCDFIIINISSLQLIPISIIAYRSQYGSVNPVGIVGPAILATMISTLAAVVFIKVMHLIRKEGESMDKGGCER